MAPLQKKQLFAEDMNRNTDEPWLCPKGSVPPPPFIINFRMKWLQWRDTNSFGLNHINHILDALSFQILRTQNRQATK